MAPILPLSYPHPYGLQLLARLVLQSYCWRCCCDHSYPRIATWRMVVFAGGRDASMFGDEMRTGARRMFAMFGHGSNCAHGKITRSSRRASIAMWQTSEYGKEVVYYEGQAEA